jgi:hypothetical protein
LTAEKREVEIYRTEEVLHGELEYQERQGARTGQNALKKKGESLTDIVTQALEEKLVRIEKEDRFERLTATAKRIAERLNASGGPKMIEIEYLYDEENGLPK